MGTTPSRRLAVASLAAALLVGGCSTTDYGSDGLTDVDTSLPKSYGSPAKKAKGGAKKGSRSTTQPVDGPAQNGTIVLRVKDGTGLPRPWIQIRVTSDSGRTSTTLMTDFAGRARATVTSGTWHAQVIPGCQQRMSVTFTDGATLEVPPNGTTRATLHAEAVRRYFPDGDARWDIRPPWPDDRNITVRVRWADRCGNTGAHAGDNIKRHVWVAGSNRIILYDAAERSDAKGWVTVTIGCDETNPGRGQDGLWFSDRYNEADEVNVLPASRRPPGGWCA